MADLHVSRFPPRLPAADLRKITRADIEQALLDYQAGAAHSFGESTDYDLINDGKRYPPKAILGLAGKHALGRVLVPDDFSGGEDSTCFRILRDHGFEVGPKPGPAIHFEIGHLYNRGQDIHKPFGGQMRGGICTPKSVPAVFLFTGKSGDQFGYVDQWSEDGSFYSFAGEGQEGNMTMKGGNRAIRDHATEGKALHLFEALGKGQPIRYMGQFDCMGHREIPGVDKHGNSRSILVFELAPHIEFKPTTDPMLLDQLTKKLATKQWTSPPRGQLIPEKINSGNSFVYARDPEIRAYILSLAAGRCELCAQKAPFQDCSGAWFLEVHHVIHLAEGGADTPNNAVALCPNCHRRLHHSIDASDAVLLLYKNISRLSSQ